MTHPVLLVPIVPAVKPRMSPATKNIQVPKAIITNRAYLELDAQALKVFLYLSHKLYRMGVEAWSMTDFEISHSLHMSRNEFRAAREDLLAINAITWDKYNNDYSFPQDVPQEKRYWINPPRMPKKTSPPIA